MASYTVLSSALVHGLMRVLFIAGYNHPAYHRKVELLADDSQRQILHITVDTLDRASGTYPSANGLHSYEVRGLSGSSLGNHDDPHRSFLHTIDFGMRGFQPDLIHVESDVETVGTAQVALARSLFARRSKLVLYSWQNILRPRKVAVRLLTRFVLRSADHVCCASQEAVSVLRRQGFGGGVSVTPVSGLDRRYFSPAAPSVSSGVAGAAPAVVGFIGRLVAEKGVDTLLRAFAQVSAPAILRIIGEGPARAALQALAATLHIEDRAHFEGTVPYDQVSTCLRSMTVLVLPSRTMTHWKEQFGRVLVEAMACKVPVIGTDSGAIREVIGDAGQLVPENDVHGLARSIDRVLHDPVLRSEMAERGYRRAMERYAVEGLALDTGRIWAQLLGESGPPTGLKPE